MKSTPTVRAASQLLAEDLGAWITRYREDERSWRWIARRLEIATSGKVVVTGEYLRQLYAESAQVA